MSTAVLVNSRTIGYPGAYEVGLYPHWGTFLSNHGITFTFYPQNPGDPDLTQAQSDALQIAQDSAIKKVNFPQAGTYKVYCVADNASNSSMTVAGQSVTVEPLQTNNPSGTNITIPSPGDYDVGITIGNVSTGVTLTKFSDNPMGLAFVITAESVIGPPSGPSECPPGPWSESIPACPSTPTSTDEGGGIRLSNSGSSMIFNLKNYAGKLVSLKMTNTKNAAWQNGFSFNIPQASDIIADGTPVGGSVYSRSSYSNPNISGTSTVYLLNLDGGDHDYVISHFSVPGPAPTRQVYTLTSSTSCSTDSDGKETCSTVFVCTPSGTQTYSPWPPCPTKTHVRKNGGDSVQWSYEDGGGEGEDQYITLEIIATRDALPSSGKICLKDDLKEYIWVQDSTAPSEVGNNFEAYLSHSEPERFRNPTTRTSLNPVPNPLCFTDLFGYVGAKTPSELGL